MHIRKNYTIREIFLLTGKHFSWLVPYVIIVAVLYRFTPLREFNIPWLPLSLIGTAVAFYVGFKNNQAYDRIWEARIVWGGIVNSSRIWGSNVKAFIVNDRTGKTDQDLLEIKKLLFYRHIAWLYNDDFYDHQGKAERIKKTPFPRQFGSYGFIMICLFIVILPFGFFSEFNKIGNYGIWLAIPFIIVISWVYILMELVGDYSENPFEGLENDVPMLSICRNIEIDLLQQLGETSFTPTDTVNQQCFDVVMAVANVDCDILLL